MSDPRHKFEIKWVTTPRCKDCTPTADMLRRHSCRGCTKYDYKKDRRGDSTEEIKNMPIENFNFSFRTYTCLKMHGINKIKDLISHSMEEVRKIKHLGPKNVQEIEEILKLNGLSLSRK